MFFAVDFILLIKQSAAQKGCTAKEKIFKKNPADKGVSAVTEISAPSAWGKAVLYGKIIGENILRSMLVI